MITDFRFRINQELIPFKAYSKLLSPRKLTLDQVMVRIKEETKASQLHLLRNLNLLLKSTPLSTIAQLWTFWQLGRIRASVSLQGALLNLEIFSVVPVVFRLNKFLLLKGKCRFKREINWIPYRIPSRGEGTWCLSLTARMKLILNQVWEARATQAQRTRSTRSGTAKLQDRAGQPFKRPSWTAKESSAPWTPTPSTWTQATAGGKVTQISLLSANSITTKTSDWATKTCSQKTWRTRPGTSCPRESVAVTTSISRLPST